MRLLKFEGGLFRRGVTESVACLWLFGFLFTKNLILGLEKFTKCCFDTNYQHKDAYDSRILQDIKSFKKIQEFFDQFDPFSDSNEVLINIANGMCSDSAVNCHCAFDVGIKIMTDIAGKNYKDLKLSRKNIVKNIKWSSSFTYIGEKKVAIDFEQLFHRACIAIKDENDMRECMKFEMAPFPPAYFNTFGMLKNNKSDLLKIFKPV